MFSSYNIALDPMIAKLRLHAEVSDHDRDAMLALPCVLRIVDKRRSLIRNDNTPEYGAIILKGFSFGHKTTRDGLRQIVSFHTPGQIVNIQQLFLKSFDHEIHAMTKCEVAMIPLSALRHLALSRVSITMALFAQAMVESSIYRQWMLNVGRRDARSRVAHLLCEFVVRLGDEGIAPGRAYYIPMTQQQIGDAVGLTSIHVNRVLRAFINEGVLFKKGSEVRFLKWEKLQDVAGFNSRYLHVGDPVEGVDYSNDAGHQRQ
ncbi:Crp/Fnr family transcriptional regulator [Sphingomonas sp. Leaf20]|uniref:Crp/Fnr family transcriptional regulator n=1 Tax=Sphingomonas sp. Leaf20 TaxID=1735685 RepID=UPI000A6AA903|nr:Crp/Fnr family transcriptional regulator [Sphingomonas sp. Leaf20]